MNCYKLEIFKDKENANNFLCLINEGVLKNPYIDPCGHSFCKSCIE